MIDDFSNVNLYFSERAKLFIMRFKKQVPGSFLGKSLKGLLGIKFITSIYPFVDSVKNSNPLPTMYSLTDRYFRYCLYRRRKFYDSKIWPLLISVIASVITAIVTTLLTLKIGL